MGNINYLNFRKFPSDEDLVETTRSFLDRVFPDFAARVEMECCLRVEFGDDWTDVVDYWRESKRKIATKGPRSHWAQWAFYLLRCHLIDTYGGTNRDECDLSQVADLDLHRYPTFADWLDTAYPNYVKGWDPEEWEASGNFELSYYEALVKQELRRQPYITTQLEAARAKGFPLEANL